VSATNDKNNFALVRKPSSEVEKITPRTKRILSSMAAETLVIAKKTSLVKIVIVDDEEWLLEMIKMVILNAFTNVTLRMFQDAKEAWQELLRADPDLFITDDIMGSELTGNVFIERLKNRNVPYPIIMHFHDLSELWVREHDGKIPNVSFLKRPFTSHQLYEELSRHLGSRLQFRNGKP
jgi:DNA-binding NtrC family response regulator